MKKLLCAMASIALLVSPGAIAQPGGANGRQQNEHRSGNDRQAQDRGSAQRQNGQRQIRQQQVRQQKVIQRQAVRRQNTNRRINQRQAAQQQAHRQAANRAYNAATYRNRNYGYADPRQYRNYGVHRGWAPDRGNAYRWSKGQRMGYYDRYYAPRVNYRTYNLRRPPYGYEWRRFDDRYVLVAITTGLIMSVILDATR
jgi:Ni/Co efflux regulator RcnB